jgi:isopentenyl phosphate kinase
VQSFQAAAEAAEGGVEARTIDGNTRGSLARAMAGEQIGTLISEGVAV